MTATAMLALRNLTRRFGDRVAVDGLELEVGRGEVFGFLGPNGAGKTTTIRLLCGLLRPTRGTIAVDGVDWREDPMAVRRSFALAPDTPPLYDYLTVSEYVGFVASLYGVDPTPHLEEQLAALGLADRRGSLCGSLSHGMRKKTHLAAILCLRRPLLILDEPTNGLDPGSTRRFKDLVLRLRDGGTTVFLSTHVLDVAEQLCDRVGVLHEGRLLACDTLAALRQGDAASSLEDVFLKLTASGPDPA